MLQRLTHKTPSPIRVAPSNVIFFTKDGRLRDYIFTLCYDLKIDPSDLYPKSLTDFQAPDITENIQILRFNNYEARRQAKLDILKTVIQQRKNAQKKAGETHRLSRVIPTPRGSVVAHPTNSTNLLVIHELPNASKELKREGSFSDKKSGPFFTEIDAMKSSRQGSEMTSTPKVQWERSRTRVNIEPLTPMFTERVRMNRGGSVGELMRSTSVRNERMQEFEKSLNRKRRNQEKACVISRTVLQQEIEQRQKLRENWQDKKEKLVKIMENKDKRHNAKAMHIEQGLKDAADRHQDLQESNEDYRRELDKQLQTKIEDCLHRKRHALNDKLRRILDLNKQDNERQQLCVERRKVIQMEGVPSLTSVENRIANGYQRAQSNRARQYRISLDFDDKLKKVREDDEAFRETNLQRTMEKMVKRSMIVGSQEKQKRSLGMVSPTKERETEHKMRMNMIKQDEEEAERRLLEELREKDMRSTHRIEGQKAELGEFIAERKEIWTQKMETLKDSQQVLAELNERQTEARRTGYRVKVEQLMTDREVMRKKREKVRLDGRMMFEGRYRGLVNN